ncbi:pyrolysin [Ceratobasidium sp. AG-Ba]|nr:pyrolysin [Ceratobasidium sp. AG-Ba]
MHEKFNAVVFDEWRGALSQLENALNSFSNMSRALYQAIDESHLGSIDHLSIEKVILRVHASMDLIYSFENKITETRAIVHRVLNRSTILSPISTLPAEILTQIFALAIPPSEQLCDIYDDLPPHPLDVIPSVCAKWRGLSVATSSLWANIHVNNGYLTTRENDSMLNRTRLWLERAAFSPLDLYIREVVEEDVGNESDLVAILEPHLSRVTSLTLCDTSQELFGIIVNLVAKRRTPGALIHLTVANVLLKLTGNSADPEPIPRRFVWPADKIHGLVELVLTDLPHLICPTLDELVALLSASPNLRVLHLKYLASSSNHNFEYPRIRIPNLQVLKIGPINQQMLLKIISCLYLGVLELDLELFFGKDMHYSEYVDMLLPFLARSNIVALSLQSLRAICTSYVASALACVPHLKFLTLDLAMPGSSDSLETLTRSTAGNMFESRLPNLRRLTLLDFNIGATAKLRLKRIVDCYKLDEVIFDCGSMIVRDSVEDMDADDFLAWLKQRVGTVVYE